MVVTILLHLNLQLDISTPEAMCIYNKPTFEFIDQEKIKPENGRVVGAAFAMTVAGTCHVDKLPEVILMVFGLVVKGCSEMIGQYIPIDLGMIHQIIQI